MSPNMGTFTLEIVDGDLALSSGGDLKQLTSVEKLAQDLSQFVLTNLGEDKFHPKIGTYINKELIGAFIDPFISDNHIRRSIANTLDYYRLLQQQQEEQQELDPDEILARVNNIQVSRDSSDPTQYNISINCITRSALVFDINTRIGGINNV